MAAVGLAGRTEEPKAAEFDAVAVHRAPKATFAMAPGRPVAAPFRSFEYTPGRVTCRLPLRDIIKEAYQLKSWQLEGPRELDGDYYDIVATMPEGTSRAEARRMLQTMMQDRFKLRVRQTQKEMNVLALVVGKDGPRLKEADTAAKGTETWGTGRCSISRGPISRLAACLSATAGRPVFDHTGLKGLYAIDLTFSPAGAEATSYRPDAPGLAAALRAQLGLQLEPRKEPHEYLIVESVRETPTEN